MCDVSSPGGLPLWLLTAQAGRKNIPNLSRPNPGPRPAWSPCRTVELMVTPYLGVVCEEVLAVPVAVVAGVQLVVRVVQLLVDLGVRQYRP